jgi:hypothetical protein
LQKAAEGGGVNAVAVVVEAEGREPLATGEEETDGKGAFRSRRAVGAVEGGLPIGVVAVLLDDGAVGVGYGDGGVDMVVVVVIHTAAEFGEDDVANRWAVDIASKEFAIRPTLLK